MLKRSEAPNYHSRQGGRPLGGAWVDHNPTVSSLYRAGYHGAAGWTWDPEEQVRPSGAFLMLYLRPPALSLPSVSLVNT